MKRDTYPDCETLIWAFLLYNKARKENIKTLRFTAQVMRENIKPVNNDVSGFLTALKFLEKNFNLTCNITATKGYFSNDNEKDISDDEWEYYKYYYDYINYCIELPDLSNFFQAYETYIEKVFAEKLIGRNLNHPNKQNIDFTKIIREKYDTSGSEEIYFSFDDIKSYYASLQLNFLEILQVKINKKEFELTGNILGEYTHGGFILEYSPQIFITGIPNYDTSEIKYYIKYTKEPLSANLNGYSFFDKKYCKFTTHQLINFKYICEHPDENYPLNRFSPNSLGANRAAISKFNKVIKNFLSSINLPEVNFLVSTHNGNAEYKINEKFYID